MNLKPLGANKTEVQTGNTTILFSYNTPVAAYVEKEGCCFVYKTEKKWSNTTTRHINTWLKGTPGVEKPQEYFDQLALEVK